MLAPNAEELALPDCLDEVEAVQVSATLHPPRNLLVLDVNGLLVHRTRSPVALADGSILEPHAQVTSYCVYDRPGLREFISMVLQHFVVGVWSSAKQHNLAGLVDHIFGRDAHRLVFVWGQERCTCIGSNRGKPLFVKELARLWAEPQFAAFGPHCTLLIDDDVYKAERNPPHTAIHPVTFTAEALQLDSALSTQGDLWTFLQGMAESGMPVTEWLRSNLFVNATTPGVDEPDELINNGEEPGCGDPESFRPGMHGQSDKRKCKTSTPRQVMPHIGKRDRKKRCKKKRRPT